MTDGRGLLNECCRSIRFVARTFILPVLEKYLKNKHANRFIFFKSRFYVCSVFIGVLYLVLVNRSNELIFAIYSIRHKIKCIVL